MTLADTELDPGEFARRFHVELLIKHPTIAPSAITSALGLEPQIVHAVGERRISANGKTLPGSYPDTRWRYSKECITSDQWFAGELEALVNRLEPHKAFFDSVLATGGTACVIIQFLGDGYFGDNLSPTILAKLGELRLDFGIEVYNVPQSS